MSGIGRDLHHEPLRILLVEDNEADAHLVRHFFESCGFEGSLDRVSDGAQAVDYLFKRGKFSGAVEPDVVLLDLGLPKISGHDVLRTVRSEERLRNLPIIVLSTSNMETDMSRCMKMGASSFMTKPCDLSEMEDLVGRLLHLEFPRLLNH